MELSADWITLAGVVGIIGADLGVNPVDRTRGQA